MATVSPMDDCGYMTLSISAIYERDLINAGAYVILEVNKNYPRTFGGYTGSRFRGRCPC